MAVPYERFETFMRQGGSASLACAGQFFMRDDPVFKTLRAITSKLAELQVPYAVAGGMALVAHGYDRTTVDVDILVRSADVAKIHQEFEGLGYVTLFTGSKNLRDARTKVKIEFLTTGSFPGDGKSKPVAFPDPTDVGVDIDGIRYLRLGTLIELKLASGMTNAGRLKDLADVQELIRVLNLPREFGEKLNPYVRAKFDELWTAVAQSPEE
jgi:hypothetical protein